jgi:hypothetical protein
MRQLVRPPLQRAIQPLAFELDRRRRPRCRALHLEQLVDACPAG